MIAFPVVVAECGPHEPVCFLHTTLLLAFRKHESTSEVSVGGKYFVSELITFSILSV